MSILTLVGSIGINLALSFSDSLARKVPTNYILLSVFTLLESYTLTCYISAFELDMVISAALISAGVSVSLFVYSMTTKKEITYFFGLAASISGVLFSFLIYGFIFGLGRTSNIVYLLMGAALSSLYLIMDIKTIVGGGRFSVSVDDYIRASMRVYMDIVILFMRILQLLNKLSDNDKKKKSKN